ncbi:MAG TPA: beta-glucosidase, partial [Clostridiaceae bacterium]|nr:beta-glucosidase [Clostridiaceae bacterium]
PLADTGAILGGWHWHGKHEETVTFKQGVEAKIGKDNLLTYSFDWLEASDADFDEALEVAKAADVVILALGEKEYMSGEGASRAFITLPGRQEEFALRALALGIPTAVVLFSGRPLEIKRVTDVAPAVLQAWFPGTEGGNALADVLFGDRGPEGRLTMSFPYTVGQVPVYYNAYNTGRPYQKNNRYTSHFMDIPNDPLFPFGYGLTYGKVRYHGFTLDKTEMTKDETITASVTVKNEGSYAAVETVQLYLCDVVGRVVRPNKELKGFKKVHLKPGEEATVTFEISEPMLRYVNETHAFASDPGEFIAMVGPNAQEVEKLTFHLIERQ